VRLIPDTHITLTQCLKRVAFYVLSLAIFLDPYPANTKVSDGDHHIIKFHTMTSDAFKIYLPIEPSGELLDRPPGPTGVLGFSWHITANLAPSLKFTTG